MNCFLFKYYILKIVHVLSRLNGNYKWQLLEGIKSNNLFNPLMVSTGVCGISVTGLWSWSGRVFDRHCDGCLTRWILLYKESTSPPQDQHILHLNASLFSIPRMKEHVCASSETGWLVALWGEAHSLHSMADAGLIVGVLHQDHHCSMDCQNNGSIHENKDLDCWYKAERVSALSL